MLWNISAGVSTGLFAGALTVAAISDLHTREIPDFCHVALLIAGIIRILCGGISVVNALAGFILIGVITLLISLWRDGMGGGDVKLIACASLSVGLKGGLSAVIIGLIPAIIVSEVKLILKRDGGAIPLAPFLALGYMLTYLH